VELNPNSAAVYNALGLAHGARHSKLSDVIWFFKIARDIDPQSPEAPAHMCQAYYEAGEVDEAERACLAALAINPRLGNVQMTLAWTYLRGGVHFDKAVRYFREVLTQTDNPAVYFGLGLAYMQLGDKAQVLESITALRDRGRNDLAQQLEDSIRPAAPAPVLPGPDLSPGPSRLVGGEAPPAAADDDGPPQPAGFTRIRLRGHLTSADEPGAMPAGRPSTPHPGSLSPSMK